MVHGFMNWNLIVELEVVKVDGSPVGKIKGFHDCEHLYYEYAAPGGTGVCSGYGSRSPYINRITETCAFAEYATETNSWKMIPV